MFDIFGSERSASEYYAKAYENGPLGQSVNGPWWSYGGSRFFLGAAGASAVLAGGVVAYEGLFATGTGELMYGRYVGDARHMMARVNGDIYHVLTHRMAGMGSAELAQTPIRWTMTIPLRNPAAAAAYGSTVSGSGAYFLNCVTGACRILFAGL